MANSNHDLLRDAIERNAAAVVSLPSAGLIRHHKTRFLSATENGFFIESPADESALLEELIKTESAVGVSFKGPNFTSIAFITPIHKRVADFKVNEASQVDALFLHFPEAFRLNQRRAVYRVALPFEQNVGVKMWRIAEHAILRDRPMASQELLVRLNSLSVQGMGLICLPDRHGDRARISAGERVRILLDCQGEDVLMEGRIVHFREIGNRQMVMGVQLKKLDKDLAGRQALSRLSALVANLQRDEIKRRRMLAEAS